MRLNQTMMYAESRKIQLIEEVLKVTNEHLLCELETVLKKARKTNFKKLSMNDFVGVLSKKDATEMRKAIKETAETINPDDWK